ncbi:hypothetical protein V5F77_02610 [Xanthobacter sp. DSM 24535]|uniref:hypothetical protein n=1 Tax=Roseixanthobacter psychrophilus TaxID=3119917 RepID=UPI00372CAE7C
MGMIAEAIRHMLAAGMEADAVVQAVAAMESAAAPARTARQERNARYYAKVASEKRLKSSEQDVSDIQDDAPPSPEQRKVSPDPSKETQPSSPSPSASPQEHTGRARSVAVAEFDRFWAAYPRKIGKDAALRTFGAVMKRNPTLTVETMVQALDAYQRFKPPDLDFCHPATWLNQGRWNDDWSGGGGTERGAGYTRRAGGSPQGVTAMADVLSRRSDSRFSAVPAGGASADGRPAPQGAGDGRPPGRVVGAGAR